MAELKGSKTEKNLLAAFAGESQAHTKYQYYASKAKKDGYVQIGELFAETAKNEKEHAKIWFKLLHDDSIPATTENLKDAAAGENYEWTDMYASRQYRGRSGLLERRRHRLAMLELRPHRSRQKSARCLPGLCASAVLFPGTC